ncbi:hypothetical protein BDQ17DRAFT_1500156 [Cyathus striatus]|nr:hypothetical protein BDQ17DRAFT_1500156 [Cyathus striatus]
MVWSKVPLISSLLAICGYIPGASARRRGVGGGIADIISSLGLDTVHSALFSFNVIFALVAAIQTLQSLRLLRNSKTSLRQLVTIGVPLFLIFLILSTSIFVTAYIMSTIDIAIDFNEDTDGSNFTPGFYTCINMLPQLGHISFFMGLLILIRHLAHLNQLAYRKGKAIMDGILILLLLICRISIAVIDNTPIIANDTAQENMVLNAYAAFVHLYAAFYVLTMINIVATTIYVKQKSGHLAAQDEMLRGLVLFICPLMLIRALEKIVYEILDWAIIDIDSDALSLADLIIVGFIFAFMIGVAIRLYLQHSWSGTVEQQQQGTENVKEQD